MRSLPGVRVLNDDSPEQSCGIGAMSIDGIGARELTEFLEARYQVHVRPRFVDGEFECIRVTPNVFTTLEEVGTFVAGVERAARRGVG